MRTWSKCRMVHFILTHRVTSHPKLPQNLRRYISAPSWARALCKKYVEDRDVVSLYIYIQVITLKIVEVVLLTKKVSVWPLKKKHVLICFYMSNTFLHAFYDFFSALSAGMIWKWHFMLTLAWIAVPKYHNKIINIERNNSIGS